MNIIKKILRYTTYLCLLVSVPLLLFFCCAILLAWVPSFFQSPNTIFWVSNGSFQLIFILELLFIIIWSVVLSRMYKIQFMTEHVYSKIMEIMKKYKTLSVLGVIILMYAVVIDTTYMTSESIAVKRVFAPFGKTYSYSDIIGVNTGMYGSKQSFFVDESGSFYYEIVLNDGTKIDLSEFSGANAKECDVYVLIEEFDEEIMKNNISKVSSVDSLAYCDFDKQHKERIEKIIMNK